MNIQITGASGSGKTFLGKKLAKVLNYNFIDTDDILWVWSDEIQPYTLSISDEQACNILEKELNNNISNVASGMFYPWAASLINRFDLLIIIEADKEVRRKRIINREYKMYGNRFIENDSMAKQFNEFLNWAMSYDTSEDKLGSKAETERWKSLFDCDILYIDGSMPIEKKLEIIVKKVKKLESLRGGKQNDNTPKIKKR